MRTKTAKTKSSYNPEPRVRFNWGFWDGRRDAEKRTMRAARYDKTTGRPTAIEGILKNGNWTEDAAYAEGYTYGCKSVGTEKVESSEPAWVEYRAAVGN